ncbi:hypothetical protein [Pseudobutyrivibrio sp.]|uniref:hypothetical protein n=1 Tax=Pseudobutyrivibrio sp. TaxID=2014367 RepID=UPI001B3F1896|nr:hypothetical protein [Pseudobutyrivibrio sp.]MBP3261383.1 hypothetical protein [Pseudobutyrivibrio sp.]
MEKKTNSLIWILLLIIVGAAFIEIAWLAFLGDTPQKYTDVIVGELATELYNKTVELALYWVVGLAGLVVIGIWAYYSYKKKSLVAVEKWNDDKIVVASIIIYSIGNYVFWGKLNPIIGFLIITAILANYKCPNKVLETMVLYLIIFYGLFGLYRIYAYFKSGISFNNTLNGILAFLLVVVFITIKNNRIVQGILLAQFLVPFSLLLFLTYKYDYQQQIFEIKPNKAFSIFIVGFILISIVSNCLKIKKYWNEDKNSKDIISSFTAAVIIAVNRASGAGFIMVTDMHHPAENTIGFKEVFQNGQRLFDEYVPVSGLFSLVQGLFLEVFGEGKYVAYSITEDLFYLVIALLVAVAIRMHVNSLITLVMSSFIYIFAYNRVVFLVPFILILLSKALLDRPLLWYIVWVILGLFYGLYYPAYGIAIIGSLIPIGVYQLPKVIGELRKSSREKKIIYLALIILELCVIIISIPLLVGMAKLVLNMSDGLLYVEGVTIFGQQFPEDFMAYMNTNDKLYTIRLLLSYFVRFTVPIIVIWLGFCSFNMVCFSESFKSKLKTRNYLVTMSAFLLPIICFYFSLMRMGAGMFNKALYIIIISALVIIVLTYEYSEEYIEKYILILACCFIYSLAGKFGIESLDDKYFTSYNVPEDFVYVQESEYYPSLGEGFVRQDILEEIQKKSIIYNSLDKEDNYFSLFASNLQADYGMAFDYIYNIKGVSLLESMTIENFNMVRTTAELLVANNATVGKAITPLGHYYLYKWLMTGGYYIWDENKEVFFPVNGQSDEEIKNANSKAVMRLQCVEEGDISASFGNSMDSLLDCSLYESDVSYTTDKAEDNTVINVRFSNGISGNEIDYMYLDLNVPIEKEHVLGGHYANNWLEKLLIPEQINTNLRYCVEYQDESGENHTIYGNVRNGKLLVLLGPGTGWLCNEHKSINIWMEYSGERVSVPDYSLKFYKGKDITKAFKE